MEHPYREQLWAQLITAYYLADRQSDALAAYRHVKATLADDLGIDPVQTLRVLNDRILRPEPLDVRKSAKTTAAGTVTVLDQRTMVSGQKAVAYLHDDSGRSYPLQSAATRIGRLSDNDIVLESANVSRHHAVIVDTGTNYIINDLRSSNGVHVRHQEDPSCGHAARWRSHSHLRPRIHVPDRRGQQERGLGAGTWIRSEPAESACCAEFFRCSCAHIRPSSSPPRPVLVLTSQALRSQVSSSTADSCMTCRPKSFRRIALYPDETLSTPSPRSTRMDSQSRPALRAADGNLPVVARPRRSKRTVIVASPTRFGR